MSASESDSNKVAVDFSEADLENAETDLEKGLSGEGQHGKEQHVPEKPHFPELPISSPKIYCQTCADKLRFSKPISLRLTQIFESKNFIELIEIVTKNTSMNLHIRPVYFGW